MNSTNLMRIRRKLAQIVTGQASFENTIIWTQTNIWVFYSIVHAVKTRVKINNMSRSLLCARIVQ